MRIASKVSHVGLDNHRKFSRVTARDAQGRILFRQRLDHADRAQLRADLAVWPPGTPVILESSFGYGWMSEELLAAGQQPHLANSRKVDGWRKSRGLAKNNRLDADLLSELWLERQRWWKVWLPPRPVRDARELLRHRMGLVQVQTTLKLRIHALLHRHGILHPWSDLFCKAGLGFLETLSGQAPPRAPDDPPQPRLGAGSRLVLGQSLKLLAQVRGGIATVTRLWRRTAQDQAPIRRWDSLPGVGLVLAHTIQAEVGDITRFAGGRKLAAYSLLAPIDDDSGDESTQAARHVGHAGRRTLKWAFIEAAHGAVKKNAALRAFWNHYTDGGKTNKGRGYIAVARKLCMAGYSCLKNDHDYTPTPPPRPGSIAPRAARRSAHSGTGLPDHPMATTCPAGGRACL